MINNKELIISKDSIESIINAIYYSGKRVIKKEEISKYKCDEYQAVIKYILPEYKSTIRFKSSKGDIQIVEY